MQIYVVSRGEYMEGSKVLSIHIDREEALKEIPMSITQDRNGVHTPGVWWENDVDYLTIEEHRLVCTAKQLSLAAANAKLVEYMEKNITEAKIKAIMDGLNCTREKAINIIEENL